MVEQAANPNAKRARRSQDDIVDAALGILDDQGLPDLTMRRIGEVLGVQASALYWHFTSKQALLAAVSGRILAPMADAETGSSSLPQAATTLGTKLRDCLLTYRDGAELVSSSLALGLIDAPLHAPLTATARELGAPETLARTAAEAITHFVIGHAFHEQQRLQADSLGLLTAPAALSPEGAVTDRDPTPGSFRSVLALIATGLATSLEPGRNATAQ